MNQIWICLIAYCLLLLMKLELGTDRTLTELMNSLKTLLLKCIIIPNGHWLPDSERVS